MISFETSVRIERPVEDVFAFLSDPLQFPRWNSAVHTVRITSGRTGELGSTYSMGRELPTGRVENELEVFARNGPGELGIRTTSGPTPFVYHYRFSSQRGATVVRLDARVELRGVTPRWGRSWRVRSGEASTRTSPLSSGPLKRRLETQDPRRRERGVRSRSSRKGGAQSRAPIQAA